MKHTDVPKIATAPGPDWVKQIIARLLAPAVSGDSDHDDPQDNIPHSSALHLGDNASLVA